MAKLDDLKEQFKNQFSLIWDKVKESSVYNQLKDRFENLSSSSQKIVTLGFGFLFLIIIISFPLQFLTSSFDQMSSYETQRDLIHDLFKIQQDSQSSTGLNPGPAQDALQSQVDNELHNSMLAPEQIRGVQNDMATITGLPKEYIESAVQISLAKLNLRQVVDIGYQILNIHPTLKMVDLNMEPNTQDPRYFDVIYKVATLKVPVFLPPPPPEEENPKKSTKKNAKSSKKDLGDE
jgi:hypothetical protein